MKKAISVLLITLIVSMLLASCGSYNVPAPNAQMSFSGADKSVPMAPPQPSVEEVELLADYDVMATSAYTGESGVMPVTAPLTDDTFAEKIIYKVSANIETVSFDETIEGVYALLNLNGGFIENSNIGGRNYAQSYHGWQTFRTAQFTLRVPVDRLNIMTADLERLGNVINTTSYGENITAQFTDTQSRLNSYKIQEERLLDMLSKSENVTDMISIEERLADVRYQIESLTSMLRNWQNRVDYSSVDLYISEVEKFTEIEPLQQKTYWQQTGDGLSATIRNIGFFFADLFQWLVINMPVLIILAVITVVVIIIVRRYLRRKTKRAKQNPQNRQDQINAQNMQYQQYQYGYGMQNPQYMTGAQATQSQQPSQNLPDTQDTPGSQSPKASQDIQSQQNP